MMDKDDKIICRCEEVLESEIRKAVEEGCRSLKAVKIRTRAGMGSCQGCTCIPLIREIISEMTGIPRSALADPEAGSRCMLCGWIPWRI